VSPEGSFPFVSFGNADQIVYMLEVNFSVDMSLSGGI